MNQLRKVKDYTHQTWKQFDGESLQVTIEFYKQKYRRNLNTGHSNYRIICIKDFINAGKKPIVAWVTEFILKDFFWGFLFSYNFFLSHIIILAQNIIYQQVTIFDQLQSNTSELI